MRCIVSVAILYATSSEGWTVAYPQRMRVDKMKVLYSKWNDDRGESQNLSRASASTSLSLNSSRTDMTDGIISVKEGEGDEKEALLLQINELASAFEQVQDTIQANAKLYEQKMDDYEEDIENLKAEIDKQIVGIMSRDNDIKELKAKLAEATNVKDEEVEILREQVKTLENDRVLQNDKIEELHRIIQDKEKIISIKEDEMEKLRVYSMEIDDEKSKLLERIEELQNSLQDNTTLEQQLVKLENQKDDLKKKNEALKEEVHVRDAEIEKINGIISNLRTNVEELQVELANRKNDLVLANKRLEEKEMEWEKDKLEMVAEWKRLSEYELVKTQKEQDNMSQTISTLELKLKEAQAQVMEVESLYQQKLKDIEDKLDGADQGDIKLRKEIIDVRAKSYKEIMDMRLKMELNEKLSLEQITSMTLQLEQYEEERQSLRKLLPLTMKRLGALLKFGGRKQSIP